MKKIIMMAVLMMAVSGVKAQLKVDTIGRVKLGTITNLYDANLLVSGRGEYGIYNTNLDYNNGKYGMYNHVYSKRIEDDVYGIFSSANGPKVEEYRKIIGVKGIAYGLRTTEGMPIGVWGTISSNPPTMKGIGVLGSTKFVLNSVVDTLYAGFFDGLTKVRGNLIVTGNIQGTLLSAPAAPSGMSQAEQTEGRSCQVMSNSLKGLTANTFYHELSDETLKALNTDHSESVPLPIDYDNLSDEELMALEEAELNAEDAIPELSIMEKQILTKQHYGLNADQLEEVFPDLVYENADGSKSINYVEMVPILVQAINELSTKLEILEGGSAAKKAPTRAASFDEMGDNLVMLSLGQNKPNPFSTTTSIDVTIPDDVQKAFIYVYDLQGKKVDQVDITARGKQTIQLNATTFSDGMYLYSLIADGKVVETRRMIVEK